MITTVERFLVSTENEETWEIDRPTIFLGEWCRTYSRKPVWDKIDAIVAQPYGIDEKTKLRDMTTVITAQEKILPELAKVLNSYHGTNYSLKFWQILIGPWFQTYMRILINRSNTISKVLDNYKVSGSTFLDVSPEDFIPKNTEDFQELVMQSSWNSTLDLKIIKSLKLDIFPIKIIKKNSSNFKCLDEKSILKSNSFRHNLQIVLNKSVKNNEPFIVSTYLPNVREKLFQLSFGMVPKNWNVRPNFKIVSESNLIIREKLRNQLLQNRQDIYSELLFDLLPLCFLEGFQELCTRVEANNWPFHPKFIFTSNNFALDEEFKLYSAIKTEQGVHYFIGQHGNNYGTNAYQFNVEEIIPDNFISWGTGNKSTNVKVGFNFKTAGVKVKHNPSGQILLLLNHLPRRDLTWDVYAEHELYFNELIQFITASENKFASMIRIRVHPGSKQINYNEREKLLLASRNLLFDEGKKSFHELLSESKLAVFSYDSTGILETLALNIPTLAFWRNGLSHLNESAKHHYEILVRAGIFHLSPISIARTINTVSHDVESWWSQKLIQDAREQFCEYYARTSKKPIRDLRKILKGSI
jgi:putative transferase (TIGR04331 family)